MSNKLSNAIKVLQTALKDPEYRIGWVSSIAVSYEDAEKRYRKEHNKVGKYLNSKDKHIISNNAAESFLNLLQTPQSKK